MLIKFTPNVNNKLFLLSLRKQQINFTTDRCYQIPNIHQISRIATNFNTKFEEHNNLLLKINGFYHDLLINND
jgi:hypothetical protein